MTRYAERRERLLSLASGYDTVVVTNPKNLFYLTDFWGGGMGVVTKGSTTLVTSVMEEKRALEAAQASSVVAAVGVKAMYDEARRRAKGRALTDQYDGRLRAKVDSGVFIEVRRKKDAEELRRIKEASRRIEKLYQLLEAVVRPGRTEREVAGDVMGLSTAEGLSPLAAEGSLSPVIIGSGPNSSFPHAELTDRRIREGDMIVADIFYRYKGYCSDCTRTYAVRRASPEAKAAYQAVLEAQVEGVRLVKNGAAAKDVHSGVSAVLRSRGLEKYFTHGTGHGVGIDIHEYPSIGRASGDVLAEGDVVTVEPGVYIPGKLGVRIEDTLALDRGTRNMYEYTKELIVI